MEVWLRCYRRASYHLWPLSCLFVCLPFSSFANSQRDLPGRFRLHDENYRGDDQIMPVALAELLVYFSTPDRTAGERERLDFQRTKIEENSKYLWSNPAANWLHCTLQGSLIGDGGISVLRD